MITEEQSKTLARLQEKLEISKRVASLFFPKGTNAYHGFIDDDVRALEKFKRELNYENRN